MTDQPDQPGQPVPPNEPTPPVPGGAVPPPVPPVGAVPPPPTPPAGGGLPPGAVPPTYGGPPAGPPGDGAVNANIGAAWSWAWSKFGKHAGVLIGLAAVVFVIQLVGQIVQRVLVNALTDDCTVAVNVDQNGTLTYNNCSTSLFTTFFAALIIGLTFGLLAWIATIGIYRAALKTTRGEVPSFSHLTTTEHLGAYIIVAICYGIAIALGIFACLIGSVIVAFLFLLAPFYALDRGEGVGTAFGNSYRAMTKNFGPALLMVLINLAASFLGGITFGLLTLVLLPFAALFTAHMYRQFNGEEIAA